MLQYTRMCRTFVATLAPPYPPSLVAEHFALSICSALVLVLGQFHDANANFCCCLPQIFWHLRIHFNFSQSLWLEPRAWSLPTCCGGRRWGRGRFDVWVWAVFLEFFFFFSVSCLTGCRLIIWFLLLLLCLIRDYHVIIANY